MMPGVFIPTLFDNGVLRRNDIIKCPKCGSKNIEELRVNYRCKSCGYKWRIKE